MINKMNSSINKTKYITDSLNITNNNKNNLLEININQLIVIHINTSYK